MENKINELKKYYDIDQTKTLREIKRLRRRLQLKVLKKKLTESNKSIYQLRNHIIIYLILLTIIGIMNILKGDSIELLAFYFIGSIFFSLSLFTCIENGKENNGDKVLFIFLPLGYFFMNFLKVIKILRCTYNYPDIQALLITSIITAIVLYIITIKITLKDTTEKRIESMELLLYFYIVCIFIIHYIPVAYKIYF